MVVSGSPKRWYVAYNPRIGSIYHLYIAFCNQKQKSHPPKDLSKKTQDKTKGGRLEGNDEFKGTWHFSERYAKKYDLRINMF